MRPFIFAFFLSVMGLSLHLVKVPILDQIAPLENKLLKTTTFVNTLTNNDIRLNTMPREEWDVAIDIIALAMLFSSLFLSLFPPKDRISTFHIFSLRLLSGFSVIWIFTSDI